MTTEKPQRKAKGQVPASTLLSNKELSKYKKYTTHVRELAFTVGFNRSGSSLIGDLLDGHPNIVMANEAGVLRKYRQGEITSREALFASIIKNSMNKSRKNFIAGQNCYDSVEVIGDKHSPNNTLALIKEGFNTLEKLDKLVKLPIKFLFTIRNPYDMIASMINTIPDWNNSQDEKLEQTFLFFENHSKNNLKLIKQVPADQIFMIRHEKFIASPKKMLSDICDFLDVVKTPEYLADCASATYKIPNRSRDTLDWDEESERKVDALIEKYEFFNGYSRNN